MFTKLCTLVGAGAAVATLAVVTSPATAPVAMTTDRVTTVAAVADAAVADTSDRALSTSTVAVLPYDGHYLGQDAGHRTVRFVLSRGRIMHFSVAGRLFPDAHVQGHQWHHTCGNSLCTRGYWTTDTVVEGKWNDARQGGDVHFTANLYSH